MKNFDAAPLYELGWSIGHLYENSHLRQIIYDREKGQEINDRDYLLREANTWKDVCASLGLALSVVTLDRIIEGLNDPAFGHSELCRLLIELSIRCKDHLKIITFLHIRADRTRFFSEPLLGWDEICIAFPSAIDDIAEAGKCLAAERGTAVVFHLMRVLEAGLKALAAPLGIPYAPSWESYLSQSATKLALPWKDKETSWKKDEEFFRESAAHLSAVKIAWRNPTMHIVKQYAAESAEEVYHATRGFMRHLATKLKE